MPSVVPIQDKKTHTDSIRFGLSFLGLKWSEETLIGFAYAYKQRTHTRLRVKCYIQPNVQLSDVIGSS
jgi:amidase